MPQPDAEPHPSETFGPEVPGESGFRRRSRFHQAWYRATVLGLSDYGELAIGRGRPLGSVLSEADGAAGHNFISVDAQRLFVKRRAEGWGLEPERCTRYMTSSQALTLNLFGSFDRDLPWLTRTLRRLLNRADILSVREFQVEYAPRRPSEHLRDKTRIDAMCWVETRLGAQAIAFEIKFLDRFNSRWIDLKNNAPYQRLFEGTGIWRAKDPALYSRQVNQLVRCHALAASVVGWAGSVAPSLVVVHHADDPGVEAVANAYRAVLTEPSQFLTSTLGDLLRAMTLEAESPANEALCQRLALRYVDEFASIDAWTRTATRFD